MKVIQNAGSALFVPSEWLHTVANLEPCLSVNANWFNAHNLMCCYRRLRRSRAMKHARDQVALARQNLKQRVLSMATMSSSLPSPLSSDESSQQHHCLESISSGSTNGREWNAPLPPTTLPLTVTEEEAPPDSSGGEAPAGKAPFDIEDLLRLLAWKARDMSVQRTTTINKRGDESNSMEIRAITEVARAMSQEESFPESLRYEASKILLDMPSCIEEAGAG